MNNKRNCFVAYSSSGDVRHYSCVVNIAVVPSLHGYLPGLPTCLQQRVRCRLTITSPISFVRVVHLATFLQASNSSPSTPSSNALPRCLRCATNISQRRLCSGKVQQKMFISDSFQLILSEAALAIALWCTCLRSSCTVPRLLPHLLREGKECAAIWLQVVDTL
jgi:hypothetical protein